MLVPFTVDPDIFLGPCTKDDEVHHEDLLKLWSQFGQLVIPSNRETESRLFKQLSAKPQDRFMQGIQRNWMHHLKFCRRKVANPEFDNVLSELEYSKAKNIYPNIKLVCLDSVRAEFWGVTDDEISKQEIGNFEFCKFGFERHTNEFKKIIELWDTPIKSGQSRRQVWDERIYDLACDVSVVVINDPYAVDNFLNSKNKADSGLGWFLLNLAKIPTVAKKKIELISCVDTGINEAYAIQSDTKRSRQASIANAYQELVEFSHELVGGSIREIEPYFSIHSIYSKVEHYRGLRFHDFNFLEMDVGLEPFAKDFVTRTNSLNLRNWRANSAEVFREDEKKVRNISNRMPIINCAP